MVLELITKPFTTFFGIFQDTTDRWFGLYIATSLFIAWIVYRRQSRRDPELRAGGFFGFVFPSEIYSHPSTKLDVWFYIINKLCFLSLFAATGLIAEAASLLASSGMAIAFDTPVARHHPIIALLTTTALYALAFDFGLWLAHYLFHRIPILWEFHKVHHSVEVLTPLSAGRVHPVDDLCSYAAGGWFGGLSMGICTGLFGSQAVSLGAFQLHIVVFIFYVVGFHLRHSHVWLPYTGWLGCLFVSPAHHQIHHSSEERHWDRNMGFMFAVWDWMFGTLYVPSKQPEAFKLGIGGEEKQYNSVARLYLLPFEKAWRVCANAWPMRRSVERVPYAPDGTVSGRTEG